MWTFYYSGPSGLAEGPSGLLLTILLIVDLPFSIVAFGVMFGGGRDGTIALIGWGVGCTLWWHLLGRGIDALGRRGRRKPGEV